MANIKSYIINKFVGLIFLFFFSVSASSILNVYFEFPYFETLEPESVLYLALSGFGFVITDLFSIASWLLPLFFLIIGLKKIIGVNIRFVFIRSLSILLSILFISFLINSFPFIFLNLNYFETSLDEINNREIGYRILAVLNENFEYIFYNKLIILPFFFLLLLLSIQSLIFGLSLKNRVVITLIVNIFSLLISTIKLLRFFRVFLYLNNIFKLKKITEKKYKGETTNYIKTKKKA